MKILISHDGSLAHYYTRLAKSRVFASLGHDVVMWDIRQKSAFDTFDSFEPDILNTQSYNLTPAIIECIKQRPALKVFCKTSDWGYKTEEISSKYEILTAKQEEIDLLLDLKRETGQPEFGFVHHHIDGLNMTHGLWEKEGFRVISLMNAADVFSFTNGQQKEKYKCDLAFLGGWWKNKSKILDKWFLPLCSNFNYNIKIFGNQNWPCPQYLGYLEAGEEKNFLSSAKICLNFHEPHSHEYHYDIVERPFKLTSNKCFMISDYVGGLEKLYGNSIVLAKSPEELKQKVDYFLENPKEKQKYIEEAYNITIKDHTYFNRMFQVLSELGMDNEMDKLLEEKPKIFQKLGL